ncbi:uncharacterized protein LOC124948518 [Vespa velutina]|uniref:uncharacterized protein LOC124948518 n=1 Tax=Vespa velutina TaxID=202808 RepID=UPI001FB4190D|nr:uncharacterized protein LOC124948518 [Vespa velutina]
MLVQLLPIDQSMEPADDKMSKKNILFTRSSENVIKKMQPLLRKFEGDEELVIHEVKDEAGSNLGDNYTSVMIRTVVIGKYGNGTPYKKSFMTKILPHFRPIAQFINTEALYVTEGYMYEKILPIIADYGPRCIYVDKDEIIMEDLREEGYINCKRQDYLDLEHTLFRYHRISFFLYFYINFLLIILTYVFFPPDIIIHVFNRYSHVFFLFQTLAKWHAKSLSIKLKDPENFEKLASPLKETIFPVDNNFAVGKTVEGGLISAIDHLESIQFQTAELKKAIEYVRSLRNKCYDMIAKLLSLPKDRYFTICHGDTWINNILYKHDKNGQVYDLKLVDYQISRHMSVAIDFHYFIYSSVRSCIIEDNYNNLIELYHRTFVEKLREYGVSEEDLKNLTMEWFKSELKTFSLYGLITGFWLIHAVLADENSVIDMDKITVNDIENMHFFSTEISPIKAERFKSITLHYLRMYKQ